MEDRNFLLYNYEAGRLFDLVKDLSWTEALLAGESWTGMHGSHHSEIFEKNDFVCSSTCDLGKVNWHYSKRDR